MRIEPLTAALGAELLEIDLKQLDTSATTALRGALLTHKVVGIRNQYLDDDDHINLAEALGEPWIHPMDRLAGIDQAQPSELRVRSDHQLLTDRWHLDVLYAPNPPPISHRAPRRSARWRRHHVGQPGARSIVAPRRTA